MSLQPDREFDDFFTEQIVGMAAPVVMGPQAGLRQVSDRGVRLEAWNDQWRLLGRTARSAWAREPASALSGQPMDLTRVPRLRRRLLLGGLLAWSLGLGLALWQLFLFMEHR